MRYLIRTFMQPHIKTWIFNSWWSQWQLLCGLCSAKKMVQPLLHDDRAEVILSGTRKDWNYEFVTKIVGKLTKAKPFVGIPHMVGTNLSWKYLNICIGIWSRYRCVTQTLPPVTDLFCHFLNVCRIFSGETAKDFWMGPMPF